ncbi:hypothetical protein Clacol_005119 [Clathrus columnatus]|uniref:tRNA-dihydrouridine(47) synthase [NAD(P)(+)] n=1 Tax=Clathrus columnatus TaxID=1419009 RepID=A0AAV5A8D2_9AGAM|nr:hypothetical protein Clacol_005119 [Clathrus columnatus]
MRWITNRYIISVDASIPVDDDGGSEGQEPPNKKQKLSGAQRKQLAKDEKMKKRGSNKNRRFGKVTEDVELCWKLASGLPCEFGDECRFTHDIKTYLKTKSRDIKLPPSSALSAEAPFVIPPNISPIDPEFSSVDFTTTCPVFESTGVCNVGLKCRFLGGHASRVDFGIGIGLIKDEEREEELRDSFIERNFLKSETAKTIRNKTYPTLVATEYLEALKLKEAKNNGSQEKDDFVPTMEFDGSQLDSPDAILRPNEKKRLDWRGKTCTRLCVKLGADITCGEMGLANSFLSASKEEWSLVRRHPSEKIFGIQLAGSKPATLVTTAEIMAKEFGRDLDFVDLNCGCPIDLVFKTGAGSALLDQTGKLGKILIGMNRALGEIPLTLKIRTGVKDGKNTAHKLMPRIGQEWGASAITIHGRSRQQRYTRLADWDYIKQCVETLREASQDDDLPTIPIFGGGDCYSSESYWSAVENTGVDGVMVARGALIKPWIFTEIKERREWDISSRERLDFIREYATFGLDHFGSDTAGVNKTRRYLCEALSFQYRYIPIGLLERLPGKINERPPLFRGRDELGKWA